MGNNTHLVMLGTLSLALSECSDFLFGGYEETEIIVCHTNGMRFGLFVDPEGVVGRLTPDEEISFSHSYEDTAVNVKHRYSTDNEYRHIRLEEKQFGLGGQHFAQTSHIFFIRLIENSAGGKPIQSSGYVTVLNLDGEIQPPELKCQEQGSDLHRLGRFNDLRERHDKAVSRPETEGSLFDREFGRSEDDHPRP